MNRKKLLKRGGIGGVIVILVGFITIVLIRIWNRGGNVWTNDAYITEPMLVAQAEAAAQADDASLAFAEANARRYRNLSQGGAGTVEEQQQTSSEVGTLTATGPAAWFLQMTSTSDPRLGGAHDRKVGWNDRNGSAPLMASALMPCVAVPDIFMQLVRATAA
jgi:hypothetical protein